MSRPVIELLHIDRTLHEARFAFRCTADIEHLFWPVRELTLYSSEGVSSTPSDLAGAFFLAMAPVGWTHAAKIQMPFRLAAGAQRAIDALGRYLANYYGWAFEDLTAGVAIDEADDTWPRLHAGLFFSGGVDSSAALAELGDRVDWLIHVSNFENLDSMTTATQRQQALDVTRHLAHSRGLGWIHLRTNIPGIFKHNRFDHKFPDDSSFWLGLAHVHHLAVALSVARPRLSCVYLAGGFNELLQKVGSCAASSPFIERYSWKPPFRLLHEHTARQQKIEYLLDTEPALLRSLRVCFSSGDGTCLECRKCQATALMIISGGGHIADTSFPTEILAHLPASVERLSRKGPEGEYFFNQCLSGRLLAGTREQRWAALMKLIREQHSSASRQRGERQK